MDDLAAFLATRLDEDEAAAKAATPGPWHADGEDILSHAGDSYWTGACAANAVGADAAHIARHDPARALREVEVKRAIISTWEDWPDYDLPPGVHDGRDDSERSRDEAIREALEAVVQALATVYADHPGYRPEWKP